jgi:molybdate-binding protein
MALIKGFQIAGEEYDFAIPQTFLALDHIGAFIKVLTTPELHARLKQRDGYGFAQTGEIIQIEERDKSKPFGFCHY